MLGRDSRKRNIPARLREETWYLVRYEDDENLRVLHEDEVCHIFEGEEDEEIEFDDIVSALWLPNGQYYDAKVLGKGADKNELMKERMKLEKTGKSGRKATDEVPPEAAKQMKRKHVEEVLDKEKTKAKKVSDEEKEKKMKKREESKRKKEEDQERHKTLLETRKAQAAARWATNSQAETEMLSSITLTTSPRNFYDKRLHGPTFCSSENTSSPSSDDDIPPCKSNSNQSTPPSINRNHETPRHLTTDSHCTPLPSTSRRQKTPRQTTSQPTTVSSTNKNHKTPRQTTYSPCTSLPTSSAASIFPPDSVSLSPPEICSESSRRAKSGSESRRGLHFRNTRCIQETSSEDEDQQVGSHSQDECCQAKSVEISELRKRLEKLHRRLNIASADLYGHSDPDDEDHVKAKTSEQLINNRPGPGVIDKALANEYQMAELIQGSGVFWYPHQRAYCSAYKNWAGYLNAAVDIFFPKDTLADSCAKGSDKNGTNADSRPPLNPLIIQALIGKVCSKYSTDKPTPSQVVQKINMKCVEARRPQRLRAPKAAADSRGAATGQK